MEVSLSAQQFEPAVEFVRVLRDPTIAYLLLVLGLTALLFEVSFPGHFLPGIAGTVLTLLALYVFGTLPVNFVGVVLVVIAFILLAAVVLAPGI
ncbi:MAG: NfeD family protein, partial [Chloroflexota bacterium]